MRRLLRIVFNALSVLSLVLALLVAGLWVRSRRYRTWDEVRLVGHDHGITAMAFSGMLMVNYATEDTTYAGHGFQFLTFSEQNLMRVDQIMSQHFPTHLYEFGVHDLRLPFALSDDEETLTYRRERSVIFPLWAPAAAFGAIGATGVLAWSRRRRRAFRNRMSLCPTCGYDLRASPDRCPECGTVKAMSSGATG